MSDEDSKALTECGPGDFGTSVRFNGDTMIVEVRGERDAATAPRIA
jgi:hypothetical protein